MKFLVLGFSPPFTNPNKATSSYLVKSEKDNVLVECGHGSVSKLLYKTKLENLTAIIISHMHPDHFYDLIPLRNSFYIKSLKRIPLYLPPGGKQILSNIVKATNLPKNYMSDFFIISDYNPVKGIVFDTFTVSMLKSQHPINNYSMNFFEKKTGKKIVYTSDTGFFPELTKFSKKADLLVVECSNSLGLKKQEWHLSPEEVAALIAKAQPIMSIITHYQAEYSDHIMKVLKNKLGKAKFSLAQEFKEFSI